MEEPNIRDIRKIHMFMYAGEEWDYIKYKEGIKQYGVGFKPYVCQAIQVNKSDVPEIKKENKK